MACDQCGKRYAMAMSIVEWCLKQGTAEVEGTSLDFAPCVLSKNSCPSRGYYVNPNACVSGVFTIDKTRRGVHVCCVRATCVASTSCHLSCTIDALGFYQGVIFKQWIGTVYACLPATAVWRRSLQEGDGATCYKHGSHGRPPLQQQQ
eukprot:XP_001700146.1 predicted protein [Chlamydomonas reinhardtii]